jgi:hypothetical protein
MDPLVMSCTVKGGHLTNVGTRVTLYLSCAVLKFHALDTCDSGQPQEAPQLDELPRMPQDLGKGTCRMADFWSQPMMSRTHLMMMM